MGQRINIQYSVDIDNLGEEVRRLLECTYTKIDFLREECTLPKETLTLKMLADIETLRHKLYSIDSSLQDIAQLVSSYVGFQAELSQQQKELPPESSIIESDEVTD
jgi:hypothetical protein